MADSGLVSMMREKTLRASFTISLVTHLLILLFALFSGQAMRRTPILQLTEIDFVEPEEAPPVQEEIVPEQKSVFELMKQVIPLKRRVEPVARPVPQPQAPPKPVFVPGAPLIGKQAITASAATSVEPMISKQSVGAGANTPKWETSPAGRTGGGRQLNLAMALDLPEARDQQVVDADVAASLQGKRGTLSLHKSSDLHGIMANVGQRKNLGLAVGAGTASGFRDAFAVFGEIKTRKILHMAMPKYPAWAEEQGIEAAATIRVGVSADGSVDESAIYVESTSGYPELDNLAVAAIKQFFFSPLPSNKNQVVQYGSIRFQFQLKR